MAQIHLDRLRARPLSWSSISSWEYDRERWAKKYLENVVEPPSKAMDFGKVIGERLASDPSFLPSVPRLPIFEHGIKYTFAGIPLVGYIDSYCPDTPAFYEYKTSGNVKKWNKKSVKEHGQIDMYAMLIYVAHGIPPEKLTIKLVYIPVVESGSFELEIGKESVQVFPVKKTMKDVLMFASKLKKTYKDMEEFAKEYNSIST